MANIRKISRGIHGRRERGTHLSAASRWRRRCKNGCAQLNAPAEFIYLGPKDEYSALLAGHGIELQPIASGKLRRYMSAQNFLDAPKFVIGFIQALVEALFHHAGRRLFQRRHRSVARRRCRMVLSHPYRDPRFRRPARPHERPLRPLRHARVPELRTRGGILQKQ